MTDVSASHRSTASKFVPAPLLSLAYRAIVIALLAGVAETLLRVTITLTQSGTDTDGLVTGLLVRTAIYLTVLTIAVRMAAGKRWARITLILGLGVVGLASLLIDPLTTVLSGDHITVDWDPESLALALFRIIHIAAVLVAVPAMIRAGRQSRA